MLWKNLINYLAFYIGWVLLVRYSNTYLIIVYGYLLLHLLLAPNKLLELCTILIISGLGFLLETTMLTLQIYQFKLPSYFCPLWFYSLWPLFASTFNYSLKKLEKISFWITGPAAALVAPFSYYAGARLNPSFSLKQPYLLSLLIIAFIWAFLFPLLIIITRKCRVYFSPLIKEAHSN